MDLDYYKSERFIHDDLCKYAATGVASLYGTWKRVRRIDPFLITWPATPVLSKENRPVEGAVVLQLPSDEPEAWRSLILEAIKATDAYALLLAEQREDDVRVILESHHGTRCWTLPIVRSGDVQRLGRAQISDDEQYVGFLWSPKKATA